MKKINKNIPKILLVDHNLDDLVLIKEELKSIALNFHIAIDGKKALESIDKNDFDIILIDIEIPNINGYEVCRTIKNNVMKCNIPVILLSSFSTYEDKIKSFKSGADAVLLRPFLSEEIIGKVQLHLQKQMVLKHMKQLLRHSYHELYNPLAVIKSSVEMFEIYNEPNKYINAIYAAAKTLHLIYDDLYYSLSVTQSTEEKKNINLHEYITKRIEYFNLVAQIRGIKFIANLDPSLSVYMHHVDLQRIIDNNLSNAIKYAFEGSEIIVSLSCKNAIELSISNKGKEIKFPDHIFKEGYREDYEKIGMGIGLDIVSSICNKYNIETVVVSKNNTTTFTYIFPRSEDENNTIRG